MITNEKFCLVLSKYTPSYTSPWYNQNIFQV